MPLGRPAGHYGTRSCGPTMFAVSLAAAALVVFVPALLADAGDASRLGFFGRDYEGNLCGQLAWRNGARARDLRHRPFTYWLNTSAAICVRACPRLADELACEYPYEAVPTPVQREHLGERCFARMRTRPVFLACVPLQPSQAAPVDYWLSTHWLDQLAADTLQASGVMLGAWCAAAALATIALFGLLLLPRTTLLVTLLAALAVAFGAAMAMLPYGAKALTSSRSPALRNEASVLREEVSGAFQLAAGWAATFGLLLLIIMLAGRAKHAPIAAALIGVTSRPLASTPSLLVLPLYLFIFAGAPLCSWVTAVAYLASPCAADECSQLSPASRLFWPLTLLAPLWLASATVAWAHVAVGGAVGCWYNGGGTRDAAGGGASLGPPLAGVAGAAGGAGAVGAGGRRERWVLWRSGWLALGSHLDAIGAATLLLPTGSFLRLLIPPLSGGAARSVNPFSRVCLGFVQGCLRCCALVVRSIHPGALVRIALHEPIGSRVLSASRPRKAAPHPILTGPSDAELASDMRAEWGGKGEWGVPEEDFEAERRRPSGPESFLDAGAACADLFSSSQAHVAAAREHAHFFLVLLKWTIALGVSLTGWMCLTAPTAPPLMSPLWPTALILEGTLAFTSAALAVHEAALEAVLQSYCMELAAAAASAGGSEGPFSARAAAASTLFGTGAPSSAPPFAKLPPFRRNDAEAAAALAPAYGGTLGPSYGTAAQAEGYAGAPPTSALP